MIAVVGIFFYSVVIVMEARFSADEQGNLDLFLSTAQIKIICLFREQAALAREAFRRFGKGLH